MKQRRTFDTGRIAESLKTKGIDPRYWAGHGVVGTIDGSGKADYEDGAAVLYASDGQWADVVLMPEEIPITARVQLGMGGRSCVISAPIRPGDEVLVVLPDGELAHPPIIVAVLNNAHDKMPLESDGSPVQRGDRLSIYAADVPIEVRTGSGARLRIEEDGEISMVPASGQMVKVGGTSELEAAALGETLQTFVNQMVQLYNTHTHVVAGTLPSGPAAAAAAPTTMVVTTVPTLTSSNVRVKK
jgi:hypothetical protein